MELFTNLGIDWRLLIAQLVNFTILLAVLYKFLYKPVLKLLHDRSQKIEQGIKNAENVEVRLKEVAALYETKTREARAEAAKILEATKKEADTMKAELAVQAQKEAEKIVSSGRARLTVEKEKIMHEAEHELADLVAQATEHVLGSVLTPEMDRKLIDEAVKKVRMGRA
ncbi:ATP synthase F0 subunit B [Candidatus Uhrbacteria bacterium RIFCSPLOWO2_01_FULL_47_24]|uniref:ATP synthase subunit b n=1 Tax=Candidatus Uhrbacteria bacterium RIFCSPLOWO2_01_FULL_47_24 TaxID=1802401 RepID=A0A1F7UQ97_9BACT|nr:MAG: ATP synthase F0 subunit B [Candidatus Uhrbacteria bacterium RIFCSPHIGHO2_02_FULL_46_47]OGL75076.1 MAG: ATP synthase F0 subunit B [Candidatus Uhrbacteria bacterium RIFCSPHIGHO2_12_FULL_47_11]OGL79914.1 MAG: ATP synthase F0 subunit B [Candidatus Uhrbacteria bacterium RIFCSPLOWO2_01_FULL_47_24]OGL84775.1 MAG: ATP synthase F0 subunit B [Candidatus Uhrbacteria bacterium RIFCSPLOWO2_02_FULL_46_25]OGL93438.1 MAG: ATP synthase F0 subunit B [Candidatus Uhrbacteria bacterium RIFCSPLOWO2_12_FULL_4